MENRQNEKANVVDRIGDVFLKHVNKFKYSLYLSILTGYIYI